MLKVFISIMTKEDGIREVCYFCNYKKNSGCVFALNFLVILYSMSSKLYSPMN